MLCRNFAGGVAVILAGTMAYDAWITSSAQTEPITISFGLTLGCLLFKLPRQMNSIQAVVLSGIALLAPATHYVGWFLSVPIIFILGSDLWRQLRLESPEKRGSLMVPEWVSRWHTEFDKRAELRDQLSLSGVCTRNLPRKQRLRKASVL